jgi:dihydroflavonol-4-reductase
MKTLVTGGNGFLGSWIVRSLIARGDSVRVLRRKNSDMIALEGLNYSSALGDVTDLNSLKDACEGIDIVFHLAGVIAYAPQDLPLMRRVNVRGTENMITAALFAKVARVVHTSSVVAVGGTLEKRFLNESSPYEMGQFHFGYYDTKHDAEILIREAVRTRSLDAVIVNPGIMFGAGDAVKDTRKMHLKVAAGKIPFYPQGGVNVLDVEDAVKGHFLALEKGKAGERYILGGENISIKEMFRLLAEFGRNRAPFIPVPNFILRSPLHAQHFINKFSLGYLPLPAESLYIGTMYHWYDMSKAQRDLGYQPKSAASAIKKSIQWCFENGIL